MQIKIYQIRTEGRLDSIDAYKVERARYKQSWMRHSKGARKIQKRIRKQLRKIRKYNRRTRKRERWIRIYQKRIEKYQGELGRSKSWWMYEVQKKPSSGCRKQWSGWSTMLWLLCLCLWGEGEESVGRISTSTASANWITHFLGHHYSPRRKMPILYPRRWSTGEMRSRTGWYEQPNSACC